MHVVTMGLLWCLRGESMVLHDVSVVSPWWPPSHLACRLRHSSGSPPAMIIICLVFKLPWLCLYFVTMAFTSSFGGIFMVSSLHVCLMVLLWTRLHLGWGEAKGDICSPLELVSTTWGVTARLVMPPWISIMREDNLLPWWWLFRGISVMFSCICSVWGH